jgi:HAD superfamily hydrolase (TIGR01509 family)
MGLTEPGSWNVWLKNCKTLKYKSMEALIFDCDGVIVDTERDGHRIAFNRAFAQKGIDAEWGVDQYRELVHVAGGKERMRYFFNQTGWPEGNPDKDLLIKELHALKTALFMELIGSGTLPLRPGVARLMDEAIARGIKLAVCSTSNEKAVNTIVDVLLGQERKKAFSAILAGDVVSRKKPDPEIYLLCQRRLGVNPSKCVVVEDNRNGLMAAKAAGMICLVTTNPYTASEDFTGADWVVDQLGDGEKAKVSIQDLMNLTG